MTLAALGVAAGGIDYRSVGGGVKRIERRAIQDKSLAGALDNIRTQIEKRDCAAKPLGEKGAKSLSFQNDLQRTISVRSDRFDVRIFPHFPKQGGFAAESPFSI
jgi:hypothetical protein